MNFRSFPYELADGPANMALDEAMLDAVAENPSTALLRTYGWTEPTLSLGYFQKILEAEADPRWSGVPIVRRPTGGGAIWHHHELTYTLVVPATYPQASPPAALYNSVHSAIALLLRTQGVDVERRGPTPVSRVRGRPFLCFTDRDPEDLIIRGFKIMGSAQRRRAGAILQHGSLLLKHSPTTPELPGAGDLGLTSPEPQYWSELLVEHLPLALGFVPSSQELPFSIRPRAVTLERTVYRSPSWTRRR
jgi:lipoate-protein ligase A